MREGFGDQTFLTAPRFHVAGIDAEIGVFDAFPCDALPTVCAFEEVTSSNASSDEHDFSGSPMSSGFSSPMFRDIDWSCHSPERKLGHNSVQPHALMWNPSANPAAAAAATEVIERPAPDLQANLGPPLYDFDFDAHPLGLGLEHDGEMHASKRARKSRDEDSRSSREGSCSDEDLPLGQKRTVLNILERARREGLKSNFHKLRDTVPDLVGNKRVPKGLILKKAADYIRELSEEARTLEFTLHHLRREQERLLAWRGLDVARCGAAPFLE